MNMMRNDRFAECISTAIDSLRHLDFKKAYKLIVEAIQVDPNAPEPHNLLGIWFELHGDEDKARRHYRAAYSLDPTFKPACKNLEQICTIFGNVKPHPYAYGDQPEEICCDFKNERKTS